MTKKRALVAIPLAALLALVAAAVLFGGRGGGATDEQSSGGAAEPGVAADASGSTALKESPTDSVRQASTTEPMSRKVISTGQVTLHSKDLAKSRSEIIRLVSSWGGSVADEQSSSDRHGKLSDTTMTLRVPSDHFDEAMNAFGTLGDVEQRSQKSEDVTTKVLDTDARVRAGERSIQQIEALLSRAQKLGDIIAIENDLARRQADLDSLKSQQAWLEDQTSLSTITVYLSRPMGPTPHEAKGFWVGLENGWHALGTTTVAALTAFGAVLPFAVLIAVIGVPVWFVRRRRLAAPVAEA
jgi:hypothetical protein